MMPLVDIQIDSPSRCVEMRVLFIKQKFFELIAKIAMGTRTAKHRDNLFEYRKTIHLLHFKRDTANFSELFFFKPVNVCDKLDKIIIVWRIIRTRFIIALAA